MKIKSQNITHILNSVTYEDRVEVNAHKGGVIWFTGLSGSGKSTLAQELSVKLFERGVKVYVLDGDNVRSGLNSDLGFSASDRSENLRRIAEVAKLFADSGMIVITAFIAPYSKDRNLARKVVGEFFHQVYINASLEKCEERDPKGLYAKARKGEIKHFTGIDDVYEEPEKMDIIIDAERLSIEESVLMLMDYIERNLLLS